MYRPKLQSVALHVPEIIAIAVLDWGGEPQSSERGGRRGVGMVAFERALVSCYRYRPTVVQLFLYLYAFQRYCRFGAPAGHFFPTTPLVSPKFPHVPLGIGGWPLGYEERRCWTVQSINQSI